MSKISDALIEQEERDMEQFAKDMDLFKKEHDEGQHKDGIVPFCERCEENRVLPPIIPSPEMQKSVDSIPECEYGHMCTSSCGNDRDCPCVSEHLCSASNESLEEAEAIIDEHECKFREKGYCTECEVIYNYRKREKDKSFFATAGRDSYKGMADRSSREIYEDSQIDPNPLDF